MTDDARASVTTRLFNRRPIIWIWIILPYWATITHWRLLVKQCRDTADWEIRKNAIKLVLLTRRFSLHFHGITAVICQGALSCAYLRQQYDGDMSTVKWRSSCGIDTGATRFVTVQLHDAHSHFAAFVDAHTRWPCIHRCSPDLRHKSRTFTGGLYRLSYLNYSLKEEKHWDFHQHLLFNCEWICF